MRPIVLLVAGLLVGVAATAAGLWLGSRAGTDPLAPGATATTTSTTTTTVVAEPIWEEPGETRLESTIILPTGLTLDDDSARLAYDLRSIAQPQPAIFGPYPAALPETWVLVTASGSRIETVIDPPGRPASGVNGEAPPLRDSVEFEIPAGTTPAEISGIEITRWRVAVPVETEVVIPSTVGSSFTTIDGTIVTLANILEQSNGTIFDFDIEREFDAWRMTEDSQQFFVSNGTFVPIGDGWTRSTFTLGTGFQLTWAGATAPEEIRIAVRTTEWMPVEGTRVVEAVVIDG